MASGFFQACASNALATVFVDYLVKPTVSHLGYVFRFNKIVRDLREHSNQLSSKQEYVEKDVKEAKNQIQEIDKEVKDWQKDALKVQQDIQSLEVKIQENKRCCFNWCPNLSWRYRLSKQAAENSHAISGLMERSSKFQRVGHPADLPGLRSFPLKEFLTSSAANLAESQIMEALKDDGVYIIGVWGMGGIGKTTLVNEVGRKAKESKLFGEVVNVVVSQNQNIEKIQDTIADLSSLRLDKKTEEGKAEQLWIGLLGKKSILIILDDVWKELDLKAVGIPIGEHHKGCKILLTTRSHKVCSDMTHMRSGRAVKLDGLEKDEAWKLFKMSAALDDGTTSPAILNVAAEVAEECNGLPIALSTLGKALKDATIEEWRDACRKLKRARLPDIACVEEDKNAYKCLKVSYDFLKNKETKICFLLCSIYPEDFSIPVEELVRHVWGLQIFQGSKSIQEARDTVYAELRYLIASCLLLDVRQGFIKMHDMVRDVALWIASQKENHVVLISEVGASEWPRNESFEAYTAISLTECKIKEIPIRLEYPKLELLSFTAKGREETLTISGASFEGMKSLKVLNLVLNGSLSNDTLHFLSNLRTLSLEYCGLNTYSISSLGELKKLEILSFYGSDIEVLPDEVGDLKSLRLLDLSYCRSLKRIPPNVIQRLSQLEESYFGGCGFDGWLIEGTDAEVKNASLLELNKLSHLAILVLDVRDLESFPENFVFPKLPNYSIAIGEKTEEVYPSRRRLKFDKVTSFKAFKNLFENVELLELGEIAGCQNIVPSLDPGGFKSLSILRTRSCKDMECLVGTRDEHEQIALSNLSVLKMEDMNCFERLCKSPPPNGFLKKLESLEIERCNKVKSLFPLSVMQSLVQLKSLEIGKCDMLEQIFEKEEIEGANEGLQKLQSLKVTYCSSLKSLLPLWVAQNLLQLESLEISECNMLEQFFEENEIEGANEGLQKLRSLKVTYCSSMKSLLPLCVAQNLLQLKSLEISECNMLEQFFEENEIEGANEGLQKLQSLKVTYCSSLKSLLPLWVAQNLLQLDSLEITECDMLEQIFKEEEIEGANEGLQMLQSLKVTYCSILKSLFPSLVMQSLVQLKSLVIDECHMLEQIFEEEEIEGANEGLQMLQSLKVTYCSSLKSLFPSSVMQSLVQLKSLVIGDCHMLEQIFEEEEIEGAKEGLQKLQSLKVASCSSLKSLFPSWVMQSLVQLKSLEIGECNMLEQIFEEEEIEGAKEGLQKLQSLKVTYCSSLKSLFPSSIMQSLVQLKSLEIGGCHMLEQIFEEEEIEGDNKVLQKLQSLKVTYCSSLKSLFPMWVAQNLVQLERLKIKGCDMLEGVVMEGGDCEMLSNNPRIHSPCFQQLNSLRIWGCPKLEYIFPSSLGENLNLPRLKTLWLKDLNQLKELVVAPRQGRDGNDVFLKLTSLRTLLLYHCPNLRSFSVSSDQLKELSIMSVGESNADVDVGQWKQNSANMEYAVIGNNAEEMFQLQHGNILSNLWHFKLRDLTELRVIWRSPNQLVTLQNLQKIWLYNCKRLRYVFSPMLAPSLPKLSWLQIEGCEEVEEIVDTSSSSSSTTSQDPRLQPFITFPNLTRIFIRGCNSLKDVFPISILPHLQQLKVIRISEASKLEQVFGFEDKADAKDLHHHHHHQEELPQLTELSLEELPSLIRFSSVDFNILFPSLTELSVTNCPQMTTTFTMNDSQLCARAQPQASQQIEDSVDAQVASWPRGTDILWTKPSREDEEE